MQNGSAKKFNGTYLLVSEDSHEYRCCCGCLHVKYGASLIGVLNVVIAMIVLTFVALSKRIVGYIGEVNAGHVIAMASATAVITTSVILMIFGVRLRRANFVIPYMIVQAACILGLVVWIVYATALILLLSASTKPSPTSVESTVIDQKSRSSLQYDLIRQNRQTNENGLADVNGLSTKRELDETAKSVTLSTRASNWWKDDTGALPMFLLITANVIYLSFGITLLTWFLVTAYKCYRYLLVKDKFTVHHLPPAYYGSAGLK